MIYHCNQSIILWYGHSQYDIYIYYIKSLLDSVLLVYVENSSLCLDVFLKFLVESAGIQNGDPSDPRVAGERQPAADHQR